MEQICTSHDGISGSQVFTQDSIHAIVPLRYHGVQPRKSVVSSPIGKPFGRFWNHSEVEGPAKKKII
jgi:hypothetical protein